MIETEVLLIGRSNQETNNVFKVLNFLRDNPTKSFTKQELGKILKLQSTTSADKTFLLLKTYYYDRVGWKNFMKDRKNDIRFFWRTRGKYLDVIRLVDKVLLEEDADKINEWLFENEEEIYCKLKGKM